MTSEESAEGAQSPWETEIRALEAEGCRAFVARDLRRLNELWSDRFVVNSPINRVLDKRRVLDLLQAGTIAHASYESHIEALHRFDGFVVVMGHEAVANSPGGPIVRRRFTNVWIAEGGSWRLIARHANVIAEAAAS